MAEGGGSGNEHENFIAAAGRAAVALGPEGGDPTKLGNEFRNVLGAVEKEGVLDFRTGAEAMDKIRTQAEEIRARGGQP